MPDEASLEPVTPSTKPHVNAPSYNRLVIAFPFSGIKINDGDKAVSALASLVAELADLVATDAPRAAVEDLAGRARALSERLAH